MLRNAAKTKELERVGKVGKVERGNWKPPDPCVYYNKENLYVSDLESDIEETYSSQGYIRQRGKKEEKTRSLFTWLFPWTHSGLAPV
jgi:hypothetical protein